MSYHDESMEKETRLKKKAAEEKITRAEEREASIQSSIENFNAQVAYIRLIQAKTEFRQKIMAQLAVEVFSALALQCCWRQSVARHKLCMRKSVRLIIHWTRYWVLHRWSRLCAAKRIQNLYRGYHELTMFRALLKLFRMIKRVQRWYRSCVTRRATRKRVVIYNARDAIIKRVFIFATTRATNKLTRQRILKETAVQQGLKNRRNQYKKACIIIRFLRKVLVQRLLQLLTSHSFNNQLQYIRISGALDARAVIENVDPTFVGRIADEKSRSAFAASGDSVASVNIERGRRGGVVPMKRPTIISGKIAKNQPEILNQLGLGMKLPEGGTASLSPAFHEKAMHIIYSGEAERSNISQSWRAHLTPHVQVVLYILSRFRPYDDKQGYKSRDIHEVSALFAYLVRKRREHDAKLHTEFVEISKYDVFKRKIRGKEAILREAAAGRSSCDHLLNNVVLAVPDLMNSSSITVHAQSGTSTSPISPTLGTDTGTGTGTGSKFNPRRGAVSSDHGITGTVGTGSPGIKGTHHRSISIINKSPRQRTRELVDMSRDGGTISTVKNKNATALTGLNLTPVNDMLWNGKFDLPLPREFYGIFKPTTIFEMISIIHALRDMVLAMPAHEFAMIVGTYGHEAIDALEDGTTTQDAIMNGEGVRLGSLTRGMVQNYVVFTETHKLIPASKARLRDIRQTKRVKLRSQEVILSAQAIVQGKEWMPKRSILLEEADEAAEAISRFYSQPSDHKNKKSTSPSSSMAHFLESKRKIAAAKNNRHSHGQNHNYGKNDYLKRQFSDSMSESASESNDSDSDSNNSDKSSKRKNSMTVASIASAPVPFDANISVSEKILNSDIANAKAIIAANTPSPLLSSSLAPVTVPESGVAFAVAVAVPATKTAASKKATLSASIPKTGKKGNLGADTTHHTPKPPQGKAPKGEGKSGKGPARAGVGTRGKKLAAAAAAEVLKKKNAKKEKKEKEEATEILSVAEAKRIEQPKRMPKDCDYHYYEGEEGEEGEKGEKGEEEEGKDGNEKGIGEGKEEGSSSNHIFIGGSGAVGVFASSGNRNGGRSGHMNGLSLNQNQIGGHGTLNLLNLTEEQIIAKEKALKILADVGIDMTVPIPEVFTPDYSFNQYTSEFTRSALLHWQMTKEERDYKEKEKEKENDTTERFASPVTFALEAHAPPGYPRSANRISSNAKQRYYGSSRSFTATDVMGEVIVESVEEDDDDADQKDHNEEQRGESKGNDKIQGQAPELEKKLLWEKEKEKEKETDHNNIVRAVPRRRR